MPDLELQRIKPLEFKWQEKESDNELEEGEIKKSEHHDYSPKPLHLLSQRQEDKNKSIQVKEDERKKKSHHNYNSVDFSQW